MCVRVRVRVLLTYKCWCMCSDRSVLKIEVFHWVADFEKLEDYIAASTGCHSALLFPTLFGLRLAEDFEFGTRFDSIKASVLMSMHDDAHYSVMCIASRGKKVKVTHTRLPSVEFRS